MQSRAYRVHGLDCAEEVTSLRREVGPVVGGADNLQFDLVGGRMTVGASLLVIFNGLRLLRPRLE